MKVLTRSRKELIKAGRWDIDFHLPPEGIKAFPMDLRRKVSDVADIVKSKHDPTKNPDDTFIYIDISSVNVSTGTIETPQELRGDEAPSRARKLVRAFDIIISTCRPTRGAIAVIPEQLHGKICSTGFSVIRAKENVNPYYLHYALRMQSTLEQFRKWSTGSSYPAILDEDVLKTIIPVPSVEMQDAISYNVRQAMLAREEAVKKADLAWQESLSLTAKCITTNNLSDITCSAGNYNGFSTQSITAAMAQLPSLDGVEEEEEDNGDDYSNSLLNV